MLASFEGKTFAISFQYPALRAASASPFTSSRPTPRPRADAVT
jgi:hypothetical protein